MSGLLELAELDAAVGDLLRQVGDLPREADQLERVAELLGISIQVGHGPAEGRLCLRDGKAVVEIHPGMPAARRRFTLAHELGHVYVLHADRALSARTIAQWPTTEAFCNEFAATLLMPADWLVARVAGRAQTLDLLHDVGRAAGASASACSLRLVRLGLWNFAFFEWQRRGANWWLRSASVLPPRRRATLRLTHRTGASLSTLTDRRSDGPRWSRLDVEDASTRRSVRAQISPGPSTIQTLVPTRTKRDGRIDLKWIA